MEEEHPIPQQISSYQFRLVGDMTLKQFFQVAAGALVALLFYTSNLAPVIKWPFIIISFLTGVALAFVPLQDRPLSKWIVLFMKAIYSPTLYIWKKTPSKMSYFQPEPGAVSATTAPSVPGQPMETEEAKKVSKLVTVVQPPELERLEKKEVEFLTKVEKSLFSAQAPTEGVVAPGTPAKKIEVEIPKRVAPVVDAQGKPIEVIRDSGPSTSSGFDVTPITGNVFSGAQSARFSLDAAPPAPPTKPNIIVGQVVSPEGKIIENAILEIRDSDGRPVRALKSNKLGHFMIVTPLLPGNYQIITEKEGYEFEPVKIEAKDQIIPAIAVLAKVTK